MRTRRTLFSRRQRIRRTIWIAAGLLGGASALRRAARQGGSRGANPPSGTLVPVNGSPMHLHCMGEGGPTVVLEPGLIGLSLPWSAVQRGVAAFTQACAYDHAGTGWSGPGMGQATGDNIVANLHTLLHNAAVPGPYILAGWSWGAHYVRLFAERYPDEVAGVVLVDPSHEDQFARFPPALRRTAGISGGMFHGLHVLARLGVLRLPAVQRALAPLLVPVPAEVRPQFQAELARPQTWESLAAKTRHGDDTEAALRRSGSLGELPLTVITAGATWEPPNRMPPGIKPGELTPLWRELQTELAHLSSRTTHRVVAEATHGNIATEHAAVVIDEIRQMVEALRRR